MKLLPSKSPSSWHAELSLLAAAALFVILLGRIQESHQIAQSRKRVANAVVALQSVENVSTMVLRAEAAQRGFLLTASEEYLRPYERSAHELSAALSDFRRAARVVGLDRQEVNTLVALTAAKFNEVQRVLELYRRSRPGEALALVRTDEGLRLMTAGSVVAGELKAECTVIFTRELDTLAQQNRNGLRTSVAGIAVVSFVIVWATLRLLSLFSCNTQLLQQYKLLARRLDSVREEERAHLAREIHDALGQTLTVIKLDVAVAARTLNMGDPALVSNKLDQVTRVVDTAIRNLRQVAKELRPPLLDSAGLAAALEVYVAELQPSTELSITLHVGQLPRLDSERAISAFRICQEALTNVMRHAEATEVTVRVDGNADGISMMIKDNGKGFVLQHARSKGSLGLLGMQERAALVGGRMNTESHPGKGTLIEFWMPIPQGAD